MERTQGLHQPLAELAARQYGVVSTRQLAELGYSRNAVVRANAAGRLHRLHRGVYAVGHTHVPDRGRDLGAVLACAPRACLSHDSAAWLWGLLRQRPGAIHVTAPTRRHARSSIRLHYARLADEDRAIREGVPVTAVPRTLLDLAAALPNRLNRALERSEELGLFDLGPVDALLERVKGHPGTGRLRRALGLYRPQAFTRSLLERRFLELVRGADMPVPSMNFNVGAYELDAYWERERFVVELDVYETHGSRGAFATAFDRRS